MELRDLHLHLLHVCTLVLLVEHAYLVGQMHILVLGLTKGALD